MFRHDSPGAGSEQSHPHYAQARPALLRVATGQDKGFMGLHSIAEIFAALTRLPVQPRIHPVEAARIVTDNILPYFEVVSLGKEDYLEALNTMESGAWIGGKIYDALLLRCAAKSAVERIYTFNLGDFRKLAPAGLQAQNMCTMSSCIDRSMNFRARFWIEIISGLAREAVSTVTRRRDLRYQGLNSRSITAALERGELERISRGLYQVSASAAAITEKHTFVQVAQLAPQGVFCLISALAFHELTVQNHRTMQIALPRPAHEPKVEIVPVEYFHFSEQPYRVGLEEHVVEGTKVKVYTPAKTVADLFKFRNRYGTDLALEALRDVWRKGKATVEELNQCAQVCRVERIMQPYLEATIS